MGKLEWNYNEKVTINLRNSIFNLYKNNNLERELAKL